MSHAEQIFEAFSQFLRKNQGHLSKAAKYILSELHLDSSMEEYDQAYFTIAKWMDHPTNVVKDVMLFKKCLHHLRQYIFKKQADKTLSRYLIRHQRLRETQNI